MKKVKSRLEAYDGYEVDSAGRSGGLALLWRKDMACTLRSSSCHYIDVQTDLEGEKWRLTGFYGWPAVHERALSWHQLRLLSEEGPDPWLCIGDFNEILYANEMKGGTRHYRQMNNFREAVNECGLRDLPYEGYIYTWDNGKIGDDNRQCRLDQAMVNSGWLKRFPFSKLFHLDREFSDHSPICVHIAEKREDAMRRQPTFIFEQAWVGEEGVEETIQRAWAGGSGSVMDSIKRCAAEFRVWKGVSIGKVVRDLKRKRGMLKKLNEGGRMERDIHERRKVVDDIAKLLRQEEIFWRQRSRALWLRDGDKNTTFFHRKASQRKTKNHIARIVTDDKRTFERTEDIAECAANYFTTLFSTTNPVIPEKLLEGMQGRVSNDMNLMLGDTFRGEEVVEALNQMHPLKAPAWME